DSTRYIGPITIDSTTTLQAIAISPYGGRSRVVTAVYTLNGVPPTAPVAQMAVAAPNAPPNTPTNDVPNEVPNSAAAPSAPVKVLLARGTAVPFVIASDVSSRTAEVGDKISLTLAEDLTAEDVI